MEEGEPEGLHADVSRPNPLGSILEAKPLHQGQKTRILGRGSQSCSHLYSTLPVPSHDVYQRTYPGIQDD